MPDEHFLLGSDTRDGRESPVSLLTVRTNIKASSLVRFAQGISPSYAMPHPSRPLIAYTREQIDGRLVLERLNDVRRPHVIDNRSSEGALPCHVAWSRRGDLLAVANYAGASVGIFRLRGSRLVQQATAVLRGSGPITDRQSHSHPHMAYFNENDQLLVPDLGSDVVWAVSHRPTTTAGSSRSALRLPSGFGPRHMLTLSGWAFVLGELSGEIAAARPLGRHSYHLIRTTPATGEDQRVQPAGIASSPDGRLLVVTNRGSNTVSGFRVTQGSDGPHLKRLWEIDSAGVEPRSVAVGHRAVVVANQLSGSVAIFPVGADHRPGQPRQMAMLGASSVETIPNATVSKLSPHLTGQA